MKHFIWTTQRTNWRECKADITQKLLKNMKERTLKRHEKLEKTETRVERHRSSSKKADDSGIEKELTTRGRCWKPDPIVRPHEHPRRRVPYRNDQGRRVDEGGGGMDVR
ncbi:hypothetical protein CEXT_291891 [Caerostris extrusa]|uniref:Uncharacterized protein n=1 Tax=Caerostris extrusa TaxID=172846 RepID=A0AAV4X0T8_CAEEX|nr:hypothetical protein CEXT_291891 [Caerostris extrusa]